MDQPPARRVTLVLCTPDGALLGCLPELEAATPWWPEAREVVDRARGLYGVHVTVLRVLGRAAEHAPPGGRVAYLAETDGAPGVPLTEWTGDDPLAEQPLRLPYARPGGPAADLRWATAALADIGRPVTGTPTQIRTWNLSSIWRIPTADGPAWLKVVPPFFAHEGEMLARLDPGLVPPLLAHDGGRVLLGDVPGEDHYDAGLPLLRRMVPMLVALQAQWTGRVDELLTLGLPDWRRDAFARAAADTCARTADQLDGATRGRLDRLLDDLDARFAGIAACGVPDTLVHGDFHAGNVRGDETRLVILDWGDSGVGSPLLDQTAFLDRIDPAYRRPLRDEWTAAWRRAVPGCDPARGAELVRPIAALRQAMIYRGFLDQIEPDEQIYHRDDPATWLRRAAELSEPG